MGKHLEQARLILVVYIGFSFVMATMVSAKEGNISFLFCCFTALMYWLATSERFIYGKYEEA